MTELLKELGKRLAALAPTPALVRVPAQKEPQPRPVTNRDKLAPRR